MELHLHMAQEVALVAHHLTQPRQPLQVEATIQHHQPLQVEATIQHHQPLQVEATTFQHHQPLQVEIVGPHQVFLLHQYHQTLLEVVPTPPLRPLEAAPQHQSV
jgi:hypothetical protein